MTPADVQRVAREIFTVNNRTIATIEPLPEEKKWNRPAALLACRTPARLPPPSRSQASPLPSFKDLKFPEPGRIRVPEVVRFQLPTA